MIGYLIKKINFILILCSCLIQSYGQQFEGDKCVSRITRKIGTCKILSSCKSALEGILVQQYPQNCGFYNSIPIVCCESTNITTSTAVTKVQQIGQISKQKCREYGRNVFKFMRAPILKPTTRPVNVSLCKTKTKQFIVGGTKAEPKEFPHMALLGYENGDNIEWICAGSLISNNYVITAAHCLYSLEFGDVKYVRVGDLNIKETIDDARPKNIEIIERIRHPNYKPPSQYNDIALLKLKRRVEFNEYIRPICLQTDYEIHARNAIATGWGKTDNNEFSSDDLLKVVIDFYSFDKCKEVYTTGISHRRLKYGIVDESQICAGGMNEHKDTCQGDSGGPLQIYNNEIYCMYNLVGITSFGKACGGLNTPGIYTRVSNYIAWIENIVWH